MVSQKMLDPAVGEAVTYLTTATKECLSMFVVKHDGLTVHFCASAGDA